MLWDRWRRMNIELHRRLEIPLCVAETSWDGLCDAANIAQGDWLSSQIALPLKMQRVTATWTQAIALEESA